MATPAEMQMRSPGYALYLIGVDPAGRVSKALVVDSMPDRKFARGLRGSVLRSRFNESPGASGLRWAMIPFSFDDRSVYLKKPGSN